MRAAFRDPDKRFLLITSFLAILSLGALQAMYGPAFPGLTDRFDIGIERVGLPVVLHFAGSFATTAAAAVLLTSLGYRRTMVAASSSLLMGILIVAFASTWSWVLAGALLGGIGFGALNVSFNLLVARAFAPNAAPQLNLLSAVFGVGAVLGPLAVGMAGSSLRLPFLGLAMVAAMATILTMRLHEPTVAKGSGEERMPWLVAGGFLLMYFLYVACEAGVASWETVHLEPSLGARGAAYMTSVYWGAVTVGRLLAVPVSAFVRPRVLVLVVTTVALAALFAAHVTALAPFAYALAGLAFAPVFPTGLAWLQRVFPRRSERVVPIVLAAANLGPVVTTGAIGALVAWGGPGLVPTALSGIATLLLVMVVSLWWVTRDA
ncbi:MAG: MFS transporter [Trueperaceae bacterium]